MKPEIEGDFELYVVTDVFYRRERGTNQNHPGQNLPNKNPCEQLLRDILYRGFLSGFVYTTKNLGVRDV